MPPLRGWPIFLSGFVTHGWLAMGYKTAPVSRAAGGAAGPLTYFTLTFYLKRSSLT
jgi:hypothetical protein